MKPYITSVRLKKDCFLLFFVNTHQHILARINDSPEISETMRDSVSHILLTPKISMDPKKETEFFLMHKRPRSYIGIRSELQKLSFLTPQNHFTEFTPNFVSSTSDHLSVKRNDQTSVARVLIYKNGNLVIQIDEQDQFNLFEEMQKSWDDLSQSMARQTLAQFDSILCSKNSSSLFDINRNQEELEKVNQSLKDNQISPEDTHLVMESEDTTYNLKVLSDQNSKSLGFHTFTDNSVGIILPDSLTVGKEYFLQIVSQETVLKTFSLKLFCVTDLENNRFLNRFHPNQKFLPFSIYHETLETLNKYYIINHLLDLSK